MNDGNRCRNKLSPVESLDLFLLNWINNKLKHNITDKMN